MKSTFSEATQDCQTVYAIVSSKAIKESSSFIGEKLAELLVREKDIYRLTPMMQYSIEAGKNIPAYSSGKPPEKCLKNGEMWYVFSSAWASYFPVLAEDETVYTTLEEALEALQG